VNGCIRNASKNIKRFITQPEIGMSVQMRESSMPTPERRQTPRTKLVEIAYIGMGPENGGLVLDVSDGGLSFHAVAPVQPAQTIRFLLSLRGQSPIEGAGQVVWTNEMRTVCGLRFTSLSSDAREHLTNWTNQSRMPEAAPEMSFAPAPSTTPQTVGSPATLASQWDTDAESVFAIPPAAEGYLSEPVPRTVWQAPFFLWIMFAFLGIALTAAAYIYGVHVGNSQISSVARPATVPDSQASAPIPVPTPVPASNLASGAPTAATSAPASPSGTLTLPTGAPTGAPKTDDISARPVQPPGAKINSTAPREFRAEQAVEAGQSDLAAALAALRGTNGTPDSSRAALLLWAAVGNGNSTAEVILADLYLRGDGVAKSCEQGRVLLRAALNRGNLEAKVKLQELIAKGCQ
jgi:hypothetical protein